MFAKILLRRIHLRELYKSGWPACRDAPRGLWCARVSSLNLLSVFGLFLEDTWSQILAKWQSDLPTIITGPIDWISVIERTLPVLRELACETSDDLISTTDDNTINAIIDAMFDGIASKTEISIPDDAKEKIAIAFIAAFTIDIDLQTWQM